MTSDYKSVDEELHIKRVGVIILLLEHMLR